MSSTLDDCPWIYKGTSANFEQEIVQKSQSVPVIVDFWAPWCAPCRQIAPILESAARAANGQFVLVKVNVDEQQELAMAFGVQSIPAVFALRNGQLADQFTGVLPEPQIRAWLAQFQPSEIDLLLAEINQLAQSDLAAADERCREVIAEHPNDDKLKIAYLKLLTQHHRDPEAHAILDQLEARGFLEPEVENVKAQLDLRAAAADAGDVPEARQALAADPGNFELKIKLADALAVGQQYADALELCIEVVQQHTGEPREQAKQTMVKIFQLLGPEADLTHRYRRKLTTLLY